MGGISSGKPVLPLITGPMMPGSFRGQRIGACTDCRNNWAAYRGDELDVEDIADLNEELAPTAGTCGVMGTASTMACIVAALGLIDLRAGAYVPGTFPNHFTLFSLFFLSFFFIFYRVLVVQVIGSSLVRLGLYTVPRTPKLRGPACPHATGGSEHVLCPLNMFY